MIWWAKRERQTKAHEALRDMFAGMLRVGDKAVKLLERIIDDDKTPVNAKLRAIQIALQHTYNYFELVALGDELAEIKDMITARGIIHVQYSGRN